MSTTTPPLPTKRRAKRLGDTQPLRGQLEYIALMDVRTSPGDVINQVLMGKVYVITRSGKPVAVLQALPGGLTINIDKHGEVTYGL